MCDVTEISYLLGRHDTAEVHMYIHVYRDTHAAYHQRINSIYLRDAGQTYRHLQIKYESVKLVASRYFARDIPHLIPLTRRLDAAMR